MKAAEIVCPKKQQIFKKSVFLQIVAKHLNDFAGDIQCQVKEMCKKFVAYSFAVNKSRDVLATLGGGGA